MKLKSFFGKPFIKNFPNQVMEPFCSIFASSSWSREIAVVDGVVVDVVDVVVVVVVVVVLVVVNLKTL